MLNKKVALVTGAGRGIGRETALQLARQNATVIVNYNGNKAAAEETVRIITEAGGTAECMQCSVADYTAVEQMVKTIIEKYGSIDILVNNAGITKDNLLIGMSEKDFDDVLDTNLKGLQLYPPCCKTDDKAKKRTNYKYYVCGWIVRQRRSGQLCGK